MRESTGCECSGGGGGGGGGSRRRRGGRRRRVEKKEWMCECNAIILWRTDGDVIESECTRMNEEERRCEGNV